MIEKHNQQKSSLDEAVILIVDDEPINAIIIAELLNKLYNIKIVHSGEDALQFCQHNTPDLILLDVVMPGISGLQTCEAIKHDQALQHIPVIFITSVTSQDDENKCWDAGGVDFVVKPVNGNTLRNRVKAHLTLKYQSDLLRKMSFVDGLTSLYNRHFLDEVMTTSILQANRNQAPLSVFMLDVDWFKLFNDRYGHLAGDECLILISKVIKEALSRPNDMPFRFGGEEFLCLLPNTNLDGAKKIAEKIQHNITALQIPHTSSPFGVVSVSIGIHTAMPNTTNQANEIILKADSALYSAKQLGRNQYATSSARLDLCG